MLEGIVTFSMDLLVQSIPDANTAEHFVNGGNVYHASL